MSLIKVDMPVKWNKAPTSRNRRRSFQWQFLMASMRDDGGHISRSLILRTRVINTEDTFEEFYATESNEYILDINFSGVVRLTGKSSK